MSSDFSPYDDGLWPVLPDSGSAEEASAPLIRRLIWLFIGLGMVLRIARYAMNYPVWWDEAFVAVNFLRRDYLDLLRPLDYGQVCPVLFLWAELTVVRLLGFSEWSLRLFPLLCALASVPLFLYAAGRVVRGWPLLLAVAIFAVSDHPIRHGADVKPYASDLLAALAIMALAFDWMRQPGRVGRLWTLAVLAPAVLPLSYPAIFVAGGAILGLLPVVIRAGGRAAWLAYLTLTTGTALTFGAMYLAFARAQAGAALGPMQVQWRAGFPPLDDLPALARWLVTVHTGSLFAYPCGGENGGSIVTLLLFAGGVAWLWRRGRRQQVLICLAPFGLALAAAALRRYPYGGVTDGSPARVMQFLVPGICLLAGTGLAALLGSIRPPRRRVRVLGSGLLALAAVGIVPMVAEASHPYRSVHAREARAFARRFWPEVGRGAQVLCLRWDAGLPEWDSTNLNVAVYLCNQAIYSSRRRTAGERPWPQASRARPLRCVLSLCDPEDCRVRGWLEAMQRAYQLRSRRTIIANMGSTGGVPRLERYVVYEFTPKPIDGRQNGRADRPADL